MITERGFEGKESKEHVKRSMSIEFIGKQKNNVYKSNFEF